MSQSGPAAQSPQQSLGFGTAPVFFTAISTILGAVLFLRFGYAVGSVGFFGTVAIVLLGHVVTICTALALAEIATNQRVEGGGEYFIISRSFGIVPGAAIGLTLFPRRPSAWPSTSSALPRPSHRCAKYCSIATAWSSPTRATSVCRPCSFWAASSSPAAPTWACARSTWWLPSSFSPWPPSFWAGRSRASRPARTCW